MVRRSLAHVTSIITLGLLAACTHGTDHDPGADEAAQTGRYAPYPTEIRAGMTRLVPLDPQNVNVGDFGSQVRNQGSIASCASFGFLGLLENQMFNERGISPDLSERFMIFSNFFQTGSLGGAPETIERFPQLVSNMGLLTEDVYPYSEVNANAHRFEQDAAQGLQTDHTQPSLASAIEGTPNESRQRSDILQRAEFIGRLPAGPYPITLPVKATLQPGARVPELELDGKIYSCFAPGGPESVPAEKRLTVTPREYLAMCFDLDPKKYFTCNVDFAQVDANAQAAVRSSDECTQYREYADAGAAAVFDANRKSLQLSLALLDRGEAVMMGVKAPLSPNNQAPIWSTKNTQPGGGHAVLGIGYVTGEELASADEQSRGLLGSGLFDRFAAAVEPAYAEKLAAGLPSDATGLRDVRTASRLGQRIVEEGGLIVFRNSWGASTEGMQIGLEGHQAMTFQFFLQAGMLVQGRTQPRVGGVAWQDDGPTYCPSTVDVPHGGAWLRSPERVEAAKTAMRASLVPATCNP